MASWYVNGQNKLPKLQRKMVGHTQVRATFSQNNIQRAELSDILHNDYNLNSLLPKGSYKVRFYDMQTGVEIIVDLYKDLLQIK